MVTSKEIFEHGQVLIDIIACALKNDTYKKEVNYEAIYKLASYHHVEGTVYLGLKDHQNEFVDKLSQVYQQIQMKVLYFEAERELILQKMREQGLSYLPLKGINLLKCYPDCGMRFMSDNDILYGYVSKINDEYFVDEQKELETQKKMNEIMISLGYKIYHNMGKDDVYTKKPFYVFEMHRRLTTKSSEYYEYFKNPWRRSKQDENDPYMYHFHLEDEYIYMMYHAYKHYNYSGFGIRYLIDIYYFLQKYDKQLNKQYIKDEFEKMGCSVFVENSLKLCFNAFDECMDQEDLKMLYYLLGSGTYGTVGISVTNQLKTKNKFQYILQRIWPSGVDYEEMYPTFYKYPILRIFLPFYRLGKALINSPKRIWVEFTTYLKK